MSLGFATFHQSRFCCVRTMSLSRFNGNTCVYYHETYVPVYWFYFTALLQHDIFVQVAVQNNSCSITVFISKP